MNGELNNLVQELIRIESPYFYEDEIMDYCQKWLKEAGFYPEDMVYDSGRNIICTIKKGEGPHICFNGHLDTVLLCDGWTKSPYLGEVEGNKMYGLGGLDMKSGCAAAMVAFRDFSKSDFKGTITLTLVSDEEGPFGLGTNALIEEGRINEVDCFVVTEPTAGFSTEHDFPVICLGARGSLKYEMHFGGKSAHACQPELGVNALVEASKFMAYAHEYGKTLPKVEPLGEGSLCVLKCEADGGACSVPDEAVVTIHRHRTMGEDEAFLKKEAFEIAQKAKVEGNFEFVVPPSPSEGCRGYEPYVVEEGNDYTDKMLMAIESACSEPVNVEYFKSIGDFNYLGTRLPKKAPVFIFGPGGKNLHGADEYVLLDTVEETKNVLLEFLKKCYGI